jgi:ferredoxin-NADP reductase
MPIHLIKLLDHENIARQTVAYRFEKPAGFTFIPGQYGGLTLTHESALAIPQSTRRFSLLSAPHDPFIAIATRLQPSPYKAALQTLPIGGVAKFAGPTGRFVLDDNEQTPAVLIAGGIGITPFYSMIRDHLYRGSTRPITLFYGNESREDAPYLDELLSLAKRHPTFQCIPCLSQPTSDWPFERGWINDALIKKYVLQMFLPHYYVCGSPAMVTALHEILQMLEIAEDHIHIEDFPGY